MQITLTITDTADGAAAVAWHVDARHGPRDVPSCAHEVAALIAELLREAHGTGALHVLGVPPKTLN